MSGRHISTGGPAPRADATGAHVAERPATCLAPPRRPRRRAAPRAGAARPAHDADRPDGVATVVEDRCSDPASPTIASPSSSAVPSSATEASIASSMVGSVTVRPVSGISSDRAPGAMPPADTPRWPCPERTRATGSRRLPRGSAPSCRGGTRDARRHVRPCNTPTRTASPTRDASESAHSSAVPSSWLSRNAFPAAASPARAGTCRSGSCSTSSCASSVRSRP